MFDFNNAEDTKPAKTVLPKGVYNVEITSAEDAVSKNGHSMFKLEFTVINGPHSGRKLWNNYIYKMASGESKATAITASAIKSMCKCAGREASFREIQDLLGMKVTVSTKISSDPTYGDKAEISFFKPYTPEETVPF